GQRGAHRPLADGRRAVDAPAPTPTGAERPPPQAWRTAADAGGPGADPHRARRLAPTARQALWSPGHAAGLSGHGAVVQRAPGRPPALRRRARSAAPGRHHPRGHLVPTRRPFDAPLSATAATKRPPPRVRHQAPAGIMAELESRFGSALAAGSLNQKVAPWPGVLRTPIWPPM